MEKLTSETFERWKRWTDKISEDLQNIVDYHQVYEYFFEMVNANWGHIRENHGGLFCDFVRRCFGVYAATGIRRHVKNDQDSISLMKLLDQLQKSASQFTYEFYLQQFPIEEDKWDLLESAFTSFSENKQTISASMILKDIETIKKIAGKVSAFTDRAIAHLDKREIQESVTYDDLAESINRFNRTACKYITLITGKGYITLKPTILCDWAKIFTVPFDIRRTKES
jgi:hypothetical protein